MMKTLTTLILLSAILNASAHNLDEFNGEDCVFPVPSSATSVGGTGYTDNDNDTFLVEANSQYSFMGDGNHIYVAAPNTVNITGEDNDVFLSDSAQANITGDGNRVFYSRKTQVTSVGVATEKFYCQSLTIDKETQSTATEKKASAPKTKAASKNETRHGIETARDVLLGMGTKTLEIADSSLGNISKYDGNSLVGSWTVVAGKYNGQTVSTGGGLNLDKNGRGQAAFWVSINGVKLPKLGPFEWRRNGQELIISVDGETNRWRHLSDTDNRHELEVWIDEQRFNITLERQS